MFELVIGNGAEAPALAKVVPDEPIGVLVGAALPGCVGVDKVEVGIKRLGDVRMLCEFRAIVGGQRMDAVFQGLRSAVMASDTASACLEAVRVNSDKPQQRSAKVTNTPLWPAPIPVSAAQSPKRWHVSPIAGRWSIGASGQLAASIVAGVTLAPLAVATRVLVEIAATAFVRQNVLVNPLRANAYTALYAHVAADLLRRP